MASFEQQATHTLSHTYKGSGFQIAYIIFNKEHSMTRQDDTLQQSQQKVAMSLSKFQLIVDPYENANVGNTLLQWLYSSSSGSFPRPSRAFQLVKPLYVARQTSSAFHPIIESSLVRTATPRNVKVSVNTGTLLHTVGILS